MRMPPLSPSELNPRQKALYDEMKAGVGAKYQDFVTTRADGAFLGPWNVWLHQPEVGEAFWAVTKAMTAFRHLDDSVRQVAIIAVGAHFGAAYEVYAHSAVAKNRHAMSDARLSTLSAGERPADLSISEAAALDVVRALLKGGVLPERVYNNALELFGESGVRELIWLVGHYCSVSMTLNGFAIGVPEDEG
ncbi:carboxymuconolactone decarboxylase family protein [Rhizobium sp. S152]|uniref:carboxymuconolactone decarboxylase family protein n=1 Tax=Rhizobium sp. S152 TaxID=3055038 RepID=UPI0025A9D291|nr:carboxymuconolactone decarboxylase family protein [Rhizobium sp. S152]MDM9627576.1 carboxymuconolactone decarboxylase family protein [Rhizobium sp. S152]